MAEFIAPLFAESSPDLLIRNYPHLFDADPIERGLFVESGGALEGGLLWVPRSYQTPRGTIRLALVSLVTTAPHLRGRGLAHSLFRELFETVRSSVDGILLWGTYSSLYRSLGFELVGEEIQFTSLAPTGLPSPSESPRLAQSSELSDRDRTSIVELFALDRSRRRYGFQLSKSELFDLLLIPKMTIAWNSRGAALLDRGLDLTNVIHDWAGKSEEVLPLIRHLAELRPKARLICPARSDLATALLDLHCPHQFQYVAMMKLLDPPTLSHRLFGAHEFLSRSTPATALFGPESFPTEPGAENDKLRRDRSGLPWPLLVGGLDSL